MPTLGLLVEPLTTPSASRAADRVLLARALARGHGTLRVSRVADDVLALGRWHLAPAGGSAVALHRRLTSGRAAATGAGFVQVSLALPHRSALVADDPLALAPEQVLNRCSDADCEPFENTPERLPLLEQDGSLPPIP